MNGFRALPRLPTRGGGGVRGYWEDFDQRQQGWKKHPSPFGWGERPSVEDLGAPLIDRSPLLSYPPKRRAHTASHVFAARAIQNYELKSVHTWVSRAHESCSEENCTLLIAFSVIKALGWGVMTLSVPCNSLGTLNAELQHPDKQMKS